MSRIRIFCASFLSTVLLLVSLAPSASALTLAACKATAPANEFNTQEMQLANCYEKEVGAAHIMLLDTDFPSWGNSIKEGNIMADSLKAWAKAGVMPLVIFDPTLNGSSTDNMNLNAFRPGPGNTYYNALSAYFKTIKKDGVTTQQMGIWVPFDEPNLPEWYQGNVSPTLFVNNIENFANNIRTFYPDVRLSIMLNSQTCQTGWTDCQQATNQSTFLSALKPYLDGLSGTNLSSFGFEGYTWGLGDNASQFLNASVAADCAQALGVTHAWFNTGTYQKVDYNNVTSLASISRRVQVLKQILGQVSQTQKAGLAVDYLNLFSQNVLDGNGTANYSYNYQNSNPKIAASDTSASLNDLRTIISEAKSLRKSVPVAIFDAE